MIPSVKVRRRNAGGGKRAIDIITRAMTGSPRSVQVGLPAGEVGADILSIGFWNEFGTTRIPERPFLRNAMRDNRATYVGNLTTIAERVVVSAMEGGEYSLSTALGQLGQKAAGDIQREITTLASPPNAPSTIRQKKSSNPLIDEGRLRQAITWKLGDD